VGCEHDHVIVTIPHDLTVVWLDHVPLMTSWLCASVRHTLCELLGDPPSLGVQPGMIAARHTWGQTLVLPPHLPGRVTGGGLTPEGPWVAAHNGSLLPGRVVMAVFRGKLLAALRRAWHRGDLQLPVEMRPQQFLNLLNRLGHQKKTRWHVRMMERSPHGRGGATYLARYLRGGPMKTSRVVAFHGREVTCRYHDQHDTPGGGTGRLKSMTLPLAELLQRRRLHVPPPHTQGVRCYGLYPHTQAAALARCRAHLGQPPAEEPVALDWRTFCAPRGAEHPERCPTCGQRLVGTAIIPRGGAPPATWGEERVA
jgi:hypothetical protein